MKNNEENTLTKSTFSFRVKPEEDAYYRTMAEEAQLPLSQYFEKIVREAHFGKLPEVKTDETKIPSVTKDNIETPMNVELKTETSTEKKEEEIPLTQEQFTRILEKLDDSNFRFIVNQHLQSMSDKHKVELEKVKEDAKIEVDKKIREENIIIPASLDQITVWGHFVEHNTKKGRTGINLIQNLFKTETFWDREPKIDKALFKKSLE